MENDKKEKEKENNEQKKKVDEKPFHYRHARANIAVDMVVFGVIPNFNELCVFVQRDDDDEKWCLPGRFMHCGNSLTEETAEEDNWDLKQTRESALQMTWPIKTIHKNKILKESVSYTIELNKDLVCQLEAMSELKRDSREKRVVSIPYMTLVSVDKDDIPSDINEYVAQWMPLSRLITENDTPGEIQLDHDHLNILGNGLKRLFQEVRTRPVGKGMLPPEFDISQLIHIYNVILKAMGVSVDRSNLRKLLLDRGVIEEINNESAPGKTGTKYRFVDETYDEYMKYLNFGFNQNQRKTKRK